MVTSTRHAGQRLLEAQLEQHRAAIQPLELAAGARVFEQGEPGERMLLIAEGQVRSSIRLPNGAERTLSHADAGDVVGEIALLTGSRRTATVTAITPVRGWTVDRHGLDQLRWDPSEAAMFLVRQLLTLTADRLRACCDRQMGEPFGDRGLSAVLPRAELPREAPTPANEYLASLFCFAGFPSPDDVAAAVRDASAYYAERGDILIHPNEPPRCLLLVARGAVEVMVRQGRTTRRVRLAGPGRFVGHNGILDDEPSPVMARCRERSVLLALPPTAIQALLSAPNRPARAFSGALLEDTARAVREASRPVASTTARP